MCMTTGYNRVATDKRVSAETRSGGTLGSGWLLKQMRQKEF